MPTPKRPFRINVGFIIHEEIGNSYDFPFQFEKITLGDDLELSNFDGIVNVGKTPQGLFVQSDFSANIPLDCVRCLSSFEHELDWSFTDLYAFDKRSETESELILPDDAHIELAELLREYAVLEIPISPICKPNCKGLCPECGQNLNDKDCGHRPANLILPSPNSGICCKIPFMKFRPDCPMVPTLAPHASAGVTMLMSMRMEMYDCAKWKAR